jgi:hypothetical protein
MSGAAQAAVEPHEIGDAERWLAAYLADREAVAAVAAKLKDLGGISAAVRAAQADLEGLRAQDAAGQVAVEARRAEVTAWEVGKRRDADAYFAQRKQDGDGVLATAEVRAGEIRETADEAARTVYANVAQVMDAARSEAAALRSAAATEAQEITDRAATASAAKITDAQAKYALIEDAIRKSVDELAARNAELAAVADALVTARADLAEAELTRDHIETRLAGALARRMDRPRGKIETWRELGDGPKIEEAAPAERAS